MALTKEFTEAVENEKKTRVRIMLKDIMLVDPSLKTFDEMLSYAERNMSRLYDEHDGEKLINDPSAWNEDYMNQQMVVVVTNFSKERIDLLGRMVKKLYAHKIETETKISRGNASGTSTSKNSNGLTGVQVAGGVIAVAGAGALIGGIVGSSATIAIAGGVAFAGGVAMVVLGGNKGA